MKKILAMLVAVATVNAFAGMISFDLTDYVGGNVSTAFSPKFSKNTEGGATDDTETMSIGLNYAHQLGNGGQVQVLFNRYTKDNGTNDGSKMTMGVGYIHNVGSDLANTVYYAGRYLMVSCDDDNNMVGQSCAKDAEWTVLQLEAGKRMKAFSTGDFGWSYSPSVVLTQTAENEEAGDQTDLNIALNLLKFDVLF